MPETSEALAGPDPVVAAAAFVALLRDRGLVVPVDATATYVEALDHVDLVDPAQVYWAGRSTLVRRHGDVEPYDQAFGAFYGGLALQTPPVEVAQSVTLAVDDPDAEPEGGDEVASGGPTIQVRFSRLETLRHADLARLDEEELAEAFALMDRLRLVGAPRRSRRSVASRRRRGGLDLARTVRRSLHAGGEPIVRSHRQPGERFRRVVLLVDVSGSMEPYARALLRFAHAAVAARSRVEAFALGTRLTRLTRDLSRRDPDDALRRVTASIEDFAGGTRLGEGLARFNDGWGVRGMARGAVVVILSDGWDRGDPDELDRELGRLGRVAHSIVWVNPLKATPGYAPLARGMAAALPHVDVFVEGHSIASLESLAGVVAGRGAGPSTASTTAIAS